MDLSNFFILFILFTLTVIFFILYIKFHSKNVVLEFILLIPLCSSVSALIYMIAGLASIFIKIQYLVFYYLLTGILLYCFYRYWANRSNSFALPIGFFILPFLLSAYLGRGDIAQLMVFRFAVTCAWPLMALTFIGALIVIWKKRKDLPERQHGKNWKIFKRAILACIVLAFSTFVFFMVGGIAITILWDRIMSTESASEVTWFIRLGANANAISSIEEGKTLLMHAAMFNYSPEVISALIKSGAKVNAVDRSGKTALRYAAFSNQNPEVLRVLIENGADVHTNDGVYTPLMVAAQRNSNPEILRVLIEYGADVNAANRFGETPLILAAGGRFTPFEYSFNPEVLRFLIKNGANLNAVDERGRTPLIAAACGRNPEALFVLIEEGADVSVMDKEGKTALDYAEENDKLKGTDAYNLLWNRTLIVATPSVLSSPEARKKASEELLSAMENANADEKEVIRLIKEGADVNEVGMNEWTPLMRAASNGLNLKILRILIANGAKVNAATENGITPLMAAASLSDNPEVLLLLIERGADVAVKNKEGKTALDYAEKNEALKSTGALKSLREMTLYALEPSRYPSPAARKKATEELLSVTSNYITDLNEVIRLIQEGADVNGTDELGYTPLEKALNCKYTIDGKIEIVRFLIENGADVMGTRENGNHPLMTAAMVNPNPEVLRLLIEKGADVNAANRIGDTPLIWAAGSNSNPDVLLVLIENGANVNVVEVDRCTPLMIAAGKNENPDVIRLLIKNGANVNATDREGKTAYDHAKKRYHRQSNNAIITDLLRPK